MAVSVRELRARIKSTQSMKKITRAMELIAASRIIKAQQRANAAAPYARELTRAVSAVATYSNVDHALTTEPENPNRAAVLVLASDRGLAGGYVSNAMREAEGLIAKLTDEGKEVDLYLVGRRSEGFFKFRGRPIAQSWTGFTDQPTYEAAKEIGEKLIEVFLEGADGEAKAPGVDEVHVVYTRFVTMMTQKPTAIRLLPLEVVEGEEAPGEGEALPLYEFEPSAEAVLDSLLPQYVNSRIWFALLQAAASELAQRQKAMKAATDNADELINKFTRIANQARQAGITQEISEIVGGVNALADAQAAND
ncbi:MAG: F0F1 ATP synthase subunit gamma [Nocardioides sp.]|uniref:F0F1 ATP synthase subunit gamma n=1 Tax=Nocardioides sp. TaxID=35761 RepID=UPI003D6A6B52